MRLRWHGHKAALRKNRHRNQILQNAWNKYGKGGMKFSAIVVCRPSDLLFFEQRFIDAMRPAYNLCQIAGNTLGLKWTEEAKRQQAARLFGRKLPEEHKANIANAHRGQKRSEKAKASMSAAQTKRYEDREERRKASVRQTGKVFSAEHKQSLSVASLGNKSHLGKSHSQATKVGISAKLVGRKLSDEVRANMSAGQRRRFNSYEVQV